jgi:hypothetical protein
LAADRLRVARGSHRYRPPAQKLQLVLSRLGQGVFKANVRLKDAAGFIARAARSLKGDPMPYLVAGGAAGMLSLLGAGELVGFLAGIALTIRKNAGAN